MPKLLIASLSEEQDVETFLMVRGRQLRSFRDRAGTFLVLRLSDKSGEIDGKVWDDAERWYGRLKSDTVVKVTGRTRVYNGRLEMNVARVRVAREDEYAIADFLPVSSRDRDEMVEELEEIIGSIANPHLAALLRAVFDPELRQQFAVAPAAKQIHHACLGGLLQHTLEVVKICRTALEIYPQVDRDLLLSGALLHDIGKVKEYSFRRSIDFSDEGRLIGHIVLGEEMLVQRARQIGSFPEDLLLRLRHMLVSHHGHYEWQSPKRPQTIEACILHLADYFSGQVAIFDASIKAGSGPDPSWSEYNRFLDRAVFIGGGTPAPSPRDEAETVRRILEEGYEGY